MSEGLGQGRSWRKKGKGWGQALLVPYRRAVIEELDLVADPLSARSVACAAVKRLEGQEHPDLETLVIYARSIVLVAHKRGFLEVAGTRKQRSASGAALVYVYRRTGDWARLPWRGAQKGLVVAARRVVRMGLEGLPPDGPVMAAWRVFRAGEGKVSSDEVFSVQSEGGRYGLGG